MADEPPNSSDISDPVGSTSPKEDAETKATREELKQTVISEKAERHPASIDEDDKTTSPDQLLTDKSTSQKKTPELDPPFVPHDALKEQVSSPKRKRAHDEVDEQKEAEEGDTADSQSNGSAAADRADRNEPLKKRPRDKEIDEAVQSSKDAPEPSTTDKGTKQGETSADKTTTKSSETAPKAGQPTTSASAFASSGFAKLSASSASPFGALGGGSSPNIFASSSGSQSPFGAVGAAKPPAPTLSFGGGGKQGSGSASPFASLNNGPSTAFGGGSVFNSGFGSGLGGTRLSSFAKPGEVLKKSDKPARPFGAPASDDEGDQKDPTSDDEDDTEGGEGEGEEKDSEREKTEEPKTVVDDKKKPKLQRVIVDDGEAGEATIFVARARLYYLDGAAWKERGAGNLKINVPERCVEYDEDGNAIAASFDASTLQDDDDEEEVNPTRTKVVRLIIRQHSTHRVILNTALMPSTEFRMNQTGGVPTVIFTGLDDTAKVVQYQMKMSANNVNSFLTLTAGIQKELRGE